MASVAVSRRRRCCMDVGPVIVEVRVSQVIGMVTKIGRLLLPLQRPTGLPQMMQPPLKLLLLPLLLLVL